MRLTFVKSVSWVDISGFFEGRKVKIIFESYPPQLFVSNSLVNVDKNNRSLLQLFVRANIFA
jgi:hypothetical protein